uniref:Endothelin-converting enzyme 1 n=1 Tax=Cacopsylla melanoneura TaxID=428564 RepID=A0A8D8TP03_9HEMI
MTIKWSGDVFSGRGDVSTTSLLVLSVIVGLQTRLTDSRSSPAHPWHEHTPTHDEFTGRPRRELSSDYDAIDPADWPHMRQKRNIIPHFNPFLRNFTENFVYFDSKINMSSRNTDFLYDNLHADPEENIVRHPIFWEEQENAETIRSNQAKLMKQYMDSTADPCVDFYQYACGNWGKINPIPKDKAAFDTFEMLRESLDSVLRDLLEAKISREDSDSYVKAKNLYASCINHDILQKRGEQPLLDLLDQFGGWPILKPDWNSKNFDWVILMGQLRLFNNDIFLSEWVGPDIKNSSEYIIQIDQQGLGLPTRDYYLQPSNRVYLDAYRNFLLTIVTLLGAPLANATTGAEEIIRFETDLARITPAPENRRNVSELYKRMSVGQLRYRVPKIDWFRYLSIILDRPVSPQENVVNFAVKYCEDLVELLEKTPPRIVSNYLLWRFVRHRVNNLDDRFQDAKQKFYFTLFGREETPPRWKTCVAQVNNNMGMAMGAMFVKKYFDENSKNDTLVMTKEIKQSFQELLAATDWIDPETKRLAAEKADVMMLRIGYPDFILDTKELDKRYQNITIHPERYFENILNILQHLTRTEQDHLGTMVNKTQWNTAPAVVNAYYSRNKNQIMFPAGILQPPFYHRHFPRGMKYGGIGVVIGHEITHGFDDKGRQFDKDGNLHRWWKDKAIHNFHERAQCLIEQYSRFVVSEVNMPLDGVNTQGENIADNGGIKQAFRAYKRWLSMNDASKETLPGLNATGLELFFLNFAQIWCGNTRPETSRNKLKTAVHAPGKFRVIGTLQNSVDFASVYNCHKGSPMNPVKKCSVW